MNEQQGHLMPQLSGLPGPRPFNKRGKEKMEDKTTNSNPTQEDGKPDMGKPVTASVDEIVAKTAEAIGSGKVFGGWTDKTQPKLDEIALNRPNKKDKPKDKPKDKSGTMQGLQSPQEKGMQPGKLSEAKTPLVITDPSKRARKEVPAERPRPGKDVLHRSGPGGSYTKDIKVGDVKKINVAGIKKKIRSILPLRRRLGEEKKNEEKKKMIKVKLKPGTKIGWEMTDGASGKVLKKGSSTVDEAHRPTPVSPGSRYPTQAKKVAKKKVAKKATKKLSSGATGLLSAAINASSKGGHPEANADNLKHFTRSSKINAMAFLNKQKIRDEHRDSHNELKQHFKESSETTSSYHYSSKHMSKFDNFHDWVNSLPDKKKEKLKDQLQTVIKKNPVKKPKVMKEYTLQLGKKLGQKFLPKQYAKLSSAVKKKLGPKGVQTVKDVMGDELGGQLVHGGADAAALWAANKARQITNTNENKVMGYGPGKTTQLNTTWKNKVEVAKRKKQEQDELGKMAQQRNLNV